jgi:hypothetical protein
VERESETPRLEIVRVAPGIGKIHSRADEIAELRKLLADPQRSRELAERLSSQPPASRRRFKQELDDLSDAFERSADISRVSAKFIDGVGRVGLVVGGGATVAIAVASAPVSGPLLIASLMGFSLYGGNLLIQLLSDMSEIDDRAASRKCKNLADEIDARETTGPGSEVGLKGEDKK